jgi:hypothetical protein
MQTFPTRQALIKELVKPGSIGAEIGVYRGGFSKQIAELGVSHLFCIDAWTVYPAYEKDSLCHTNQDDNMQATKHELRSFIADGKCSVIKGFSAEVGRAWVAPLDFIFLDGNHEYSYVLEDLRVWSKHIKDGGVIMCHDYTNREAALAMDFGVIPAVSRFCEEEGWEVFAITEEGDWPSCALRRK